MVKIKKSKKRVHLSFWQTIGHYSFVAIPLLFLASSEYSRSDEIYNLPSIPTNYFIAISISIFFGYLKWRELIYFEFQEARTDEEFENAVLATANRLSWFMENLDNSTALAIGCNPKLHRDFQKIHIIREHDKVLINSRIRIDFISVPDIFGVNKKNRKHFFHYYQLSNKVENLNEKVIQKKKERAEKTENESEWTFVNTHVFGY